MKLSHLVLALGTLLAPVTALADHQEPQEDVYDIISRIDAGQPFRVQLDYDIGTLAARAPYDVYYTRWSQLWTASGYSLGSGSYTTATYRWDGLYRAEICIWGAWFTFDPYGNLYYHGGARVGRLYF